MEVGDITLLLHDQIFLEKMRQDPVKISSKNRASEFIPPCWNWKCWNFDYVCLMGLLTPSTFQKVTSVWQSDVHRILIRTSHASGGATSISSIISGSPAFLATAAGKLIPNNSKKNEKWEENISKWSKWQKLEGEKKKKNLCIWWVFLQFLMGISAPCDWTADA